ncbi:hypothetical protein HG471_001695 [Candidatus Saccharibacteria bacterium]|nr:hypothetical protein [Candidatus Saccharibacteria bacterium]
MDDSMDIALQSLLYLTLGLIPGGLYDGDDFLPLWPSRLETTKEGGSESHESESLKRKRDYEDIKRRFYHESNRTE